MIFFLKIKSTPAFLPKSVAPAEHYLILEETVDFLGVKEYVFSDDFPHKN